MHKQIAAAALIAAAMMPAMAQTHPAIPSEGEVKIIFNEGSPDPEVYDAFIENAPRRYRDASAPRFAVKGADNKFWLGIGGNITGVGCFDWGNPLESAYDFTTSGLQKASAGNGGAINGGFGESRVFVNFIAMPGMKDRVGAYVGGKFSGAGGGFHLHHAYITWRGVLAGYTNSLFEDGAACAPTVDAEGPCGFVGLSNTVLQWRGSLCKGVSAGAALELPVASVTQGRWYAAVSQRVPDVPVYLQYGWGSGSDWVRLSAIVRNIQYRDLFEDKNRNAVGWGVKVSGTSALGYAPALRAYYQMCYGKGVGSYIQDLTGLGLDLTPGRGGKMRAVEAWGGYAGLQYTFSPRCFATATYSQTRVYDSRYGAGWDVQYKYAQYVAANCFYTIVPGLQCGVEYLYGRRVDMDGLSVHDNRINTMLQFNF